MEGGGLRGVKEKGWEKGECGERFKSPILTSKPGLGPLQWKNYFDYLITDANKPLFFTEGSILREVDEVRVVPPS